MNGMFLLLTLTSIVHSVNDSLFRSGDKIQYSLNLSDIHSLINYNNIQCQVKKHNLITTSLNLFATFLIWVQSPIILYSRQF